MTEKKKRKSAHRVMLRAPYTPTTSVLKSFKTYILPKKKFKYINL